MTRLILAVVLCCTIFCCGTFAVVDMGVTYDTVYVSYRGATVAVMLPAPEPVVSTDPLPPLYRLMYANHSAGFTPKRDILGASVATSGHWRLVLVLSKTTEGIMTESDVHRLNATGEAACIDTMQLVHGYWTADTNISSLISDAVERHGDAFGRLHGAFTFNGTVTQYLEFADSLLPQQLLTSSARPAYVVADTITGAHKYILMDGMPGDAVDLYSGVRRLFTASSLETFTSVRDLLARSVTSGTGTFVHLAVFNLSVFGFRSDGGVDLLNETLACGLGNRTFLNATAASLEVTSLCVAEYRANLPTSRFASGTVTQRVVERLVDVHSGAASAALFTETHVASNPIVFLEGAAAPFIDTAPGQYDYTDLWTVVSLPADVWAGTAHTTVPTNLTSMAALAESLRATDLSMLLDRYTTGRILHMAVVHAATLSLLQSATNVMHVYYRGALLSALVLEESVVEGCAVTPALPAAGVLQVLRSNESSPLAGSEVYTAPPRDWDDVGGRSAFTAAARVSVSTGYPADLGLAAKEDRRGVLLPLSSTMWATSATADANILSEPNRHIVAARRRTATSTLPTTLTPLFSGSRVVRDAVSLSWSVTAATSLAATTHTLSVTVNISGSRVLSPHAPVLLGLGRQGVPYDGPFVMAYRDSAGTECVRQVQGNLSNPLQLVDVTMRNNMHLSSTDPSTDNVYRRQFFAGAAPYVSLSVRCSINASWLTDDATTFVTVWVADHDGRTVPVPRCTTNIVDALFPISGTGSEAVASQDYASTSVSFAHSWTSATGTSAYTTALEAAVQHNRTAAMTYIGMRAHTLAPPAAVGPSTGSPTAPLPLPDTTNASGVFRCDSSLQFSWVVLRNTGEVQLSVVLPSSGGAPTPPRWVGLGLYPGSGSFNSLAGSDYLVAYVDPFNATRLVVTDNKCLTSTLCRRDVQQDISHAAVEGSQWVIRRPLRTNDPHSSVVIDVGLQALPTMMYSPSSGFSADGHTVRYLEFFNSPAFVFQPGAVGTAILYRLRLSGSTSTDWASAQDGLPTPWHYYLSAVAPGSAGYSDLRVIHDVLVPVGYRGEIVTQVVDLPASWRVVPTSLTVNCPMVAAASRLSSGATAKAATLWQVRAMGIAYQCVALLRSSARSNATQTVFLLRSAAGATMETIFSSSAADLASGTSAPFVSSVVSVRVPDTYLAGSINTVDAVMASGYERVELPASSSFSWNLPVVDVSAAPVPRSTPSPAAVPVLDDSYYSPYERQTELHHNPETGERVVILWNYKETEQILDVRVIAFGISGYVAVGFSDTNSVQMAQSDIVMGYINSATQLGCIRTMYSEFATGAPSAVPTLQLFPDASIARVGSAMVLTFSRSFNGGARLSGVIPTRHSVTGRAIGRVIFATLRSSVSADCDTQSYAVLYHGASPHGSVTLDWAPTRTPAPTTPAPTTAVPAVTAPPLVLEPATLAPQLVWHRGSQRRLLCVPLSSVAVASVPAASNVALSGAADYGLVPFPTMVMFVSNGSVRADMMPLVADIPGMPRYSGAWRIAYATVPVSSQANVTSWAALASEPVLSDDYMHCPIVHASVATGTITETLPRRTVFFNGQSLTCLELRGLENWGRRLEQVPAAVTSPLWNVTTRNAGNISSSLVIDDLSSLFFAVIPVNTTTHTLPRTAEEASALVEGRRGVDIALGGIRHCRVFEYQASPSNTTQPVNSTSEALGLAAPWPAFTLPPLTATVQRGFVANRSVTYVSLPAARQGRCVGKRSGFAAPSTYGTMFIVRNDTWPLNASTLSSAQRRALLQAWVNDHAANDSGNPLVMVRTTTVSRGVTNATNTSTNVTVATERLEEIVQQRVSVHVVLDAAPGVNVSEYCDGFWDVVLVNLNDLNATLWGFPEWVDSATSTSIFLNATVNVATTQLVSPTSTSDTNTSQPNGTSTAAPTNSTTLANVTVTTTAAPQVIPPSFLKESVLTRWDGSMRRFINASERGWYVPWWSQLHVLRTLPQHRLGAIPAASASLKFHCPLINRSTSVTWDDGRVATQDNAGVQRVTAIVFGQLVHCINFGIVNTSAIGTAVPALYRQTSPTPFAVFDSSPTSREFSTLQWQVRLNGVSGPVPQSVTALLRSSPQVLNASRDWYELVYVHVVAIGPLLFTTPSTLPNQTLQATQWNTGADIGVLSLRQSESFFGVSRSDSDGGGVGNAGAQHYRFRVFPSAQLMGLPPSEASPRMQTVYIFRRGLNVSTSRVLVRSVLRNYSQRSVTQYAPWEVHYDFFNGSTGYTDASTVVVVRVPLSYTGPEITSIADIPAAWQRNTTSVTAHTFLQSTMSPSRAFGANDELWWCPSTSVWVSGVLWPGVDCGQQRQRADGAVRVSMQDGIPHLAADVVSSPFVATAAGGTSSAFFSVAPLGPRNTFLTLAYRPELRRGYRVTNDSQLSEAGVAGDGVQLLRSRMRLQYIALPEHFALTTSDDVSEGALCTKYVFRSGPTVFAPRLVVPSVLVGAHSSVVACRLVVVNVGSSTEDDLASSWLAPLETEEDVRRAARRSCWPMLNTSYVEVGQLVYAQSNITTEALAAWQTRRMPSSRVMVESVYVNGIARKQIYSARLLTYTELAALRTGASQLASVTSTTSSVQFSVSASPTSFPMVRVLRTTGPASIALMPIASIDSVAWVQPPAPTALTRTTAWFQGDPVYLYAFMDRTVSSPNTPAPMFIFRRLGANGAVQSSSVGLPLIDALPGHAGYNDLHALYHCDFVFTSASVEPPLSVADMQRLINQGRLLPPRFSGAVRMTPIVHRLTTIEPRDMLINGGTVLGPFGVVFEGMSSLVAYYDFGAAQNGFSPGTSSAVQLVWRLNALPLPDGLVLNSVPAANASVVSFLRAVDKVAVVDTTLPRTVFSMSAVEQMLASGEANRLDSTSVVAMAVVETARSGKLDATDDANISFTGPTPIAWAYGPVGSDGATGVVTLEAASRAGFGSIHFFSGTVTGSAAAAEDVIAVNETNGSVLAFGDAVTMSWVIGPASTTAAAPSAATTSVSTNRRGFHVLEDEIPTYAPTELYLQLKFVVTADVWVGFGIAPNGTMSGADSWIMYATRQRVPGSVSGTTFYELSDRHDAGPLHSTPVQDTVNNLELLSLLLTSDGYEVVFRRALATSDPDDLDIRNEMQTFIWAYGPYDITQQVPLVHARRGVVAANLYTGQNIAIEQRSVSYWYVAVLIAACVVVVLLALLVRLLPPGSLMYKRPLLFATLPSRSVKRMTVAELVVLLLWCCLGVMWGYGCYTDYDVSRRKNALLLTLGSVTQFILYFAFIPTARNNALFTAVFRVSWHKMQHWLTFFVFCALAAGWTHGIMFMLRRPDQSFRTLKGLSSIAGLSLLTLWFILYRPSARWQRSVRALTCQILTPRRAHTWNILIQVAIACLLCIHTPRLALGLVPTFVVLGIDHVLRWKDFVSRFGRVAACAAFGERTTAVELLVRSPQRSWTTRPFAAAPGQFIMMSFEEGQLSGSPVALTLSSRVLQNPKNHTASVTCHVRVPARRHRRNFSDAASNIRWLADRGGLTGCRFRVEGPYGSINLRFKWYSTAVFIGASTGAGSVVAFLENLIFRPDYFAQETSLETVTVVILAKTASELSTYATELYEMLRAPRPFDLQLLLFATSQDGLHHHGGNYTAAVPASGVKPPPTAIEAPVKNAAPQMANAQHPLFQDVTVQSGRPQWTHLFASEQIAAGKRNEKRVAVHVSGPHSLVTEVLEVCDLLTPSVLFETTGSGVQLHVDYEAYATVTY